MSLTSAKLFSLKDKLKELEEKEVKQEVEEAVAKVGEKKLKVKKEQ